MSKMSELAAGLKELRRCGEVVIGVSDALITGAGELKHCGEVLTGVADSLVELFSSTDEQPKAVEQKTEQPALPEKAPMKLTDVRKILTGKSRAGYTAEVKALLRKHGAEKLSEIDPAEYEALAAEAEVIGNA